MSPDSIPPSEREFDQRFEELYEQIRGIAQHYMRREEQGHTLSPTELVHEAYQRLRTYRKDSWQNESHFLAWVTMSMRRVLVDHARRRRVRRQGIDSLRVSLAPEAPGSNVTVIDLLDLDDMLRKLGNRNARQERVFVLRQIGGLTVQETAVALDVSERTVKNDFRLARAWLRRALSRETTSEDD